MLIKIPLTKPLPLMHADVCSFGSIWLSEEYHSNLKLPINSSPYIHILNSLTTLIELSYLFPTAALLFLLQPNIFLLLLAKGAFPACTLWKIRQNYVSCTEYSSDLLDWAWIKFTTNKDFEIEIAKMPLGSSWPSVEKFYMPKVYLFILQHKNMQLEQYGIFSC